MITLRPTGSDDTDNIQEALDIQAKTNERIYLRAGEFRVNKTLKVTGETFQIEGEGRRSSSIIASSGNWDIFNIPNNVYGARLASFQIKSAGDDRMGGAFFNFEGRCIESTFQDLDLRRWYDGFRFNCPARIVITGCQFSCANRKTMANAAINLQDRIEKAQCTGIHITDCEAIANTPERPAYLSFVKVEAVDGLYLQNNHCNDAKYCMLFNPDLDTHEHVISVHVVNNYFDKAYRAHVRFGGKSNSFYGDIRFVGNLFRASQANSIVFQQDEDMDTVSFVANHFRLNQQSAIYSAQSTHRVNNLLISNNQFADNCLSNDPKISDIMYRGNDGFITGNLFSGKHDKHIHVLSGAENVTVFSNYE